MVIEDPETTDEEDKVDSSNIEALIKKMGVIRVSDFATPELVTEEEKLLWRHTYHELKAVTKAVWASQESDKLRDKVNLCLGKLIMRGQK